MSTGLPSRDAMEAAACSLVCLVPNENETAGRMVGRSPLTEPTGGPPRNGKNAGMDRIKYLMLLLLDDHTRPGEGFCMVDRKFKNCTTSVGWRVGISNEFSSRNIVT